MGRTHFQGHLGGFYNSFPMAVYPTPASSWLSAGNTSSATGGLLQFLETTYSSLPHEHCHHGPFIKEARRVSSVCYQDSLIYCDVITGVASHQPCWFSWLEAAQGSARIKGNRITQKCEHQIMGWRNGRHLSSALPATVGEKNKELLNLRNIKKLTMVCI